MSEDVLARELAHQAVLDAAIKEIVAVSHVTAQMIAPASFDQLKDAQPGSFYFAMDYRHLIFKCPDGCGDVCAIVIRNPVDPETQPSWTWNGNESSPTLSPMLQRTTGCRWNGFLTAGEWVRVNAS